MSSRLIQPPPPITVRPGAWALEVGRVVVLVATTFALSWTGLASADPLGPRSSAQVYGSQDAVRPTPPARAGEQVYRSRGVRQLSQSDFRSEGGFGPPHDGGAGWGGGWSSPGVTIVPPGGYGYNQGYGYAPGTGYTPVPPPIRRPQFPLPPQPYSQNHPHPPQPYGPDIVPGWGGLPHPDYGRPPQARPWNGR